MIRLRWVAIGLTAFALACANAFAQIVPDDWTGNGTPSFNDMLSWANGIPNINDIMEFSPQFSTGSSGNNLTMNVAGTASGIDIEAFGGAHGNISIGGGASTLTLGASGLVMDGTNMSNSSVAFINAPLAFSAIQNWSINASDLTLAGPINNAGFGLTWNVNGSDIIETVASTISGTGALTIANAGGLMNVAINTGTSTFSGGTTVTGGAGTVVVIGASTVGPAGFPISGPFGTGVLTLGNFVDITTANNGMTETIGNDIAIGSGAGAQTMTFQANVTGGLVLTGTIVDGSGGPGTIDVTGPNIGPVTFSGNNSYSGGTNIAFATVNVTNDSGLGFGPVMANNSTVNFTSNAPTLFNPSFGNSTTVNFSGTLPNLVAPSITINSTVNFTTPGSDILIDSLNMVNSTLNFAASSTVNVFDMASDAMGSTNSINLNASTILVLNEIGSVDYYGTITGANSTVGFESDGLGIYDLHGANTFSGGSAILSGVIVVADNNSALGTGLLQVNGGALAVGPGITLTNQISASAGTIAGYGAINPGVASPILFFGSGFLSGGKGTLVSEAALPVPGILTFGASASLTLSTGGTLQFSIMNASAAGIGVAGTDYSTISAPNSTVTVSSTVLSPFTIQLVSVNPGTGQVGLANFDPTQTYQWTLLSAGTINGFASNLFTIDDTTDFQNSLAGGAFSVAQMGNNLVLDFTPVPEPSTWALMATGLCAVGAAVRRRRR